MTAYYNEIDPYAAQWLRNLIAAGQIAPGVVDTRSIEDVHPADLQDFTQCHFFAGVGVWSLALRRAGWGDDRPVWTGSCPCQPFSAAGQGAGFADERHLWPAFHHLIRECKPAAVLGEQVASKDADPWIDLVHTDLEALGYAFGAIPFPSAGIGAPHIRDRLYWAAVSGDRRDMVSDRNVQQLANANDARLEGRRISTERAAQRIVGARGLACGLADAHGGNASTERQQRGGEQRQQPEDGSAVRLGVADNRRLKRPGLSAQRSVGGDQLGAQRDGKVGSGDDRNDGRSGNGVAADFEAGPTNGYWADADWLSCRDGKWRPVEPGTFPLAHGAASRVGRLRAYGNAINAEAARVFVEAVMEATC